MTLLYQGKAVPVSSEIPAPSPSQSSHRSPSHRFGRTVELRRMHTPPPQPPESPAGKDIRSRGSTAGSSWRQSCQSQAPSSRRSSSGSAWDMAAGALPSARAGAGKARALPQCPAPGSGSGSTWEKRGWSGAAAAGETGWETLPEPRTRPWLSVSWKVGSEMRVLAVLIAMLVAMVCEMGDAFNKLNWLESGLFKLLNTYGGKGALEIIRSNPPCQGSVTRAGDTATRPGGFGMCPERDTSRLPRVMKIKMLQLDGLCWINDT